MTVRAVVDSRPVATRNNVERSATTCDSERHPRRDAPRSSSLTNFSKQCGGSCGV